MSQSRKSYVPAGIVIGVIFGLLLQFRAFRIFMLILVGVGSVFFLYDWLFTESTLPNDIQGAYQFSATVTQEPDLSFTRDDPKFDVNFSLANTYNETIQTFIIDTTLYDCASASTPIEDCSKVTTQGYGPSPDVVPGETWNQDERVVFMGSTINGYPKVTFAIHDVVVDSDNKGNPEMDAQDAEAQAKWNAL